MVDMMHRSALKILLGVAVLVFAEPNVPRPFLSTFDECDTECFDDFLSYGYTEGYAKYSCCFSYRLELTKVALGSRSAANLDRESIVCDQDCYTEYFENGYSEEMSVNKCCYSNEGENQKLYRTRPHHFGGGSNGSSHNSSPKDTHLTPSHGSSSNNSHRFGNGSDKLRLWHIALITVLILVLAGGGIYATLIKSSRKKLISRAF